MGSFSALFPKGRCFFVASLPARSLMFVIDFARLFVRFVGLFVDPKFDEQVLRVALDCSPGIQKVAYLTVLLLVVLCWFD